jgi:transcriptional regulator with XRE-family HTH domain
MGYRGKTEHQERARELRGDGWSLLDIAEELGVSKSSASIWTRGIEFEPRESPRLARVRGPNALQRKKQAEIAEMDAKGRERLAELSEQAFLVAGVALYAGEGAKKDGSVIFANSDASMVAFFCRWLRWFFDVDEQRLRVRVYLHEGLDLDAATTFWSDVTGVPVEQFGKPYRAAADPSIRTAKHVHGCCYVRYSCTRTHREVMGLIRGLLSGPEIDPG